MASKSFGREQGRLASFECHRFVLVRHRLTAVNLLVAVRVLHETHAQSVKLLTWVRILSDANIF